MIERITCEVNDTNLLNERIIQFFKNAEFKRDESYLNSMRFYQTDSIFEAWKNNPLKWKSEIIIKTQSNTVLAEFNVDKDVQMFTNEEERVWKYFIEDFQNSMSGNNVIELTYIGELYKNKRIRISYLNWLFIGALTGGLIATIVTKYFDYKTMVYFSIPVFAIIFLRLRIKFGRHHNAL